MALPREILPGSTYLITRRCTQRMFLLRPDEEVNQIFLYCLAVAAQRTGVQIHAYCVLSNHWHAVVTDVDGRLPEFAHFVHLYVAKGMNTKLKREENFWSTTPYSGVRLEAPDDIVDKIVYTLTNPVAAGLVPRTSQWPGLHSAGLEVGGKPLQVQRPKGFFRPDGPMPEQASVHLFRPPGFASMSHRRFSEMIRTRVAERERELQAAMRGQKRRFLGRTACRKVRRTQRPSTREPRFQLSPRIAARDQELRKAAIERQHEFVHAYRTAREKWKGGCRNALFPAGTYWLRIHARVRCRAPTG